MNGEFWAQAKASMLEITDINTKCLYTGLALCVLYSGRLYTGLGHSYIY